MRVVCCTYYSPSYKALADISLPNLSEYCARHGYYMWVENIENDKWEYVKHEMFKELFKKGFDLIWYRDVDSIITNITIPITDFIDDKRDFFVTEDVNELNGGSVILKNSEWGRWLNNMVLSHRDYYDNEQNVYNAYRDMLMISGCMKVLPHPSINSYLYENYPEVPTQSHEQGQWEEGDFLLHLPGMGMDRREEILKSIKIKR